MKRKRKCSECNEPAKVRGYCTRHYCSCWYRAVVDSDPNGYRAAKGCLVKGCDLSHHGHGYCRNHANHLRLHGDPLKGGKRIKGVCKVKRCTKPHAALGYCSEHYGRFRRHGDPLGGNKKRGHPIVWPQIPQRYRTLASDYAIALRKGIEPTPELRAGVNEYQKRVKALRAAA